MEYIKVIKWLENVLLIILIINLFVNIEVFYSGIHNIDLSYNINKIDGKMSESIKQSLEKEYLVADVDIQMFDKGSDFKTRPIDDYYIAGMNQITRSLIIISCSILLIGVMIGRKWQK